MSRLEILKFERRQMARKAAVTRSDGKPGITGSGVKAEIDIDRVSPKRLVGRR